MTTCHIGKVKGVAVLALLGACTSYGSSDSPGEQGDAGAASDAWRTEDDAAIVRTTFPDRLTCGQAAVATVVLRNTGSATWSRSAGYGLAAGGDRDPLHPGDARIGLADGDLVLPGATHAFDISLVGPATPGAYTTLWQMIHERVRRFGATTSHDVVVDCPASPDGGVADAMNAVDAGDARDAMALEPFDISTAIVRNSPPDVASWAVTARITTLDLQASGVYVNFTKRDGAGSWPDVPFGKPGDSLQYTLWIAINVDGKWYTSGCIQYWRGLERNGGPPSEYAKNWYYDAIRWGPMVGRQPAVGEKVGFFVTAGNARNVTDRSGSKVFERSNVVIVPFPSDAGAIFKY